MPPDQLPPDPTPSDPPPSNPAPPGPAPSGPIPPGPIPADPSANPSANPASFEPYQPPSGPGRGEPKAIEAFACPNCGSTQFNPGFIDDATGNASVRWFQGPIEYGLLGGIKRSGRPRRVIMSYRCTGCSRLELYAGEET